MKKQLLSRKRLKTLFCSLCLMLLFANNTKLQAQTATDGDYRTVKVSGNWSDADMWETRTAGIWASTAVAPTATNNVYVQNGHSVNIDVANANCKDLQLNVVGVLAIGENTVNVSGKIRAYTTTLGAVIGAGGDGTFYSDQTSSTALASTMISTTNSGVLKFVGGTRNISNVGEWNASGTINAAEFALDANAIGTLNGVGVKFKPIVLSSGTVATDSFVSVSTGDFTIKNGAKFVTSRSSTSGVIGNSSSAICGIVTIESGGILELTGSAPTINCTTFINNGTVIYNRAGTQTLLSAGVVTPQAGTTEYNNYSTLLLSNTSTKTPSAPITVSSLLKFTGTATLAATAINSLTMLNGSTVERSVTSGTSLPSAVGAVLYGTSSTDLVNVTIGTTVLNSNEFVSSPTPGKVGTLTINSGVTYTVTGGRTAINIVNNGIISLVPTSTFTFNINGSISGSGTISGHTNASIAFGGSTDGNAGTLNFTTGFQVANNLTINRSGTNASVTLGTPVTILNISPTTTTLGLSAGTLINSGFITLGNGAIIARSGGSIDAAPVFGTSVTLNYNSSVAKTIGFEMPNSSAIATTVNISSGAVTLNNTKNISSLTLTSGSLTLASGSNLTIQNALTATSNASAVVVESGANLIQVNNVSNTGDITVKRNSNPLYRLDYTMWSSPTGTNQKLNEFSPLTTTGRFFEYNSGTNKYNIVADATPFSQGKGFLIRMPNTDPTSGYDAGTATLSYEGVFTGIPNNGDVNIAGTAGQYVAVGNPYPSTISADAFIDANSDGAGSGTLYFWRKTNNLLQSSTPTTSYATYTKAGPVGLPSGSGTANGGFTPNGFIAVGQGFIATVPTSGTIAFTNALRSSSTTAQFLRTKAVAEKSRVWLNLSSGTNPVNQMMVAYMNGATTGVDNGIDGKYINDSPTALTSDINNEEYVIQGRPAFDDSDIVALNFKTDVAGTFTIAKDRVDGLFAAGQDIYLVDATTGTETNLQTDAYTFTAAVGVDNSRFKLTYKTSGALKVNDLAFDENSISVYKQNGVLNINAGKITMKNVKVFDITGRLILEQKAINANTTSLKNLGTGKQALLIQITSNENKVVTKKAIN